MPTESLTEPDHADLVARFEAVLPGQGSIAVDLLRRYGEPHRRYHTVDHLRSVLDRIDTFDNGSADLYAVRLAAWFHDAVYDVPERELTNEEASARLAIRTLGRIGLEQEDLNEIARLVRMTGTHHPGSKDPNGNVLSDADLAVLAGSEQEYAAYVNAVREEYAAIADEDFYRGRLRVLMMLRRGQLFRTGKGHKLEQQAQANLDREIDVLADLLGLDLDELDPEDLRDE